MPTNHFKKHLGVGQHNLEEHPQVETVATPKV